MGNVALELRGGILLEVFKKKKKKNAISLLLHPHFPQYRVKVRLSVSKSGARCDGDEEEKWSVAGEMAI